MAGLAQSPAQQMTDGPSETANLAPKQGTDEAVRWRTPSLWPREWWWVVGLVSAIVLAGAICLLGLPGWLARLAGRGPLLLTDKPQSDSRLYQYAQLPNGLHVLNVQDALTLKTSFAVSVMAGSFDDPVELPGLAHFCEHMVFLGTEKYPLPSDFDNFMSRNAGSDNAYTAAEVTVYFGEVSEQASDEALDRFADFFRLPLFDRRYVQKEVHAIDSEHSKNVQSPTRRIMEVMNSMADPGSPVSRFHTGNFDTLYEAPHRKGTDPVNALQDYFEHNYCPARMRLVTLGSAPLAEQLKMAEKHFGAIPPSNGTCAEAPRSFSAPAPFPPERLGKWLVIEGTQPQASLWLHFAMPDLSHEYLSHPTMYIDYVMTYKGENSLSRVLQDGLGLVSSFSTMYDTNTAGTSFYFVLKLTTDGQENMGLALDVIYSYIAKLRKDGVDSALYQTIADVTKLKWDWASPSDTLDTVSDLAERMTRLPPESTLSGDSRIDKLDPALVASLMSKLTPDNMNVAYIAAADTRSIFPAGKQILSLPHYDVKYAVRDLEDEMPGAAQRWRRWLAPSEDSSMQADLQAALRAAGVSAAVALPPSAPQPIADVPKTIALDDAKTATAVPSEGVDGQLFGPRPTLLSLPNGELRGSKQDSVQLAAPQIWFRSGWVTSSPKVQLQLALRPMRSPEEPEPSVGDTVQLMLYGRLLREEITPKLADLTATGVLYDISISSTGVGFAFGGFAPMMPRLATTVLELFNNFNLQSNTTSPERFNRLKQGLQQELATYSDMPVSYAAADRMLLITRGPYSRAETLAAVEPVTLQSAVEAAGRVLLSRPLQLTALAMGNMKSADALALSKQISEGIKVPAGLTVQPAGGEVELVTRVINPSQPVEVRARNPRAGDPNDVVSVSLIYGPSTIPSRVILGLIGQILSVLAYNELRTVRQLGYVVNAGASSVSNIQFVAAVVQGTALKADEAEAAIEHVLTDLMPRRLQTITDEEFGSYLSSFKQSLLNPPMAPSEEVDHFWEPVKQGGGCFELRGEILRYLNTTTVTKELLAATWASLATPKDRPRKKVAVKYFANEVPSRPTAAQASATWAKQGVAASAVRMLLLERERTLVVGKADSSVRRQLLEKGGYFAPTLQCHLEPAGAKDPAALVQSRAWKDRLRPGQAFLSPR